MSWENLFKDYLQKRLSYLAWLFTASNHCSDG